MYFLIEIFLTKSFVAKYICSLLTSNVEKCIIRLNILNVLSHFSTHLLPIFFIYLLLQKMSSFFLEEYIYFGLKVKASTHPCLVALCRLNCSQTQFKMITSFPPKHLRIRFESNASGCTDSTRLKKERAQTHSPNINTNLRLTVGTPDIKITMTFCYGLQHTNTLLQDKKKLANLKW